MLNLKCLFVSYSNLDNGHDAAYVDMILMKDLITALENPGTPIRIRCFRLDNMRYAWSEVTVERNPSRPDTSVLIIYGDTEYNRKNSIDVGVVRIEWAELKDVFEMPPKVVVYEPKPGDDGVCKVTFPEFAFLRHEDADAESFTFLDHKQTPSIRTEIFHKEKFDETKKMFDKKVYSELLSYVQERVDATPEDGDFTVGQLFPNPWPQEIMPIYNTILAELKDEREAYKKSAYFLSGLVQSAILKSPHKWQAQMVKWPNRPHASMMFRRLSSSK